jgi:hypothetical protein
MQPPKVSGLPIIFLAEPPQDFVPFDVWPEHPRIIFGL